MRALALLLALAACAPAEPPVDPVLADRQAIDDLVARFADAAVRADADAFASLWADGGRWDVGPPLDRTFQGRTAIRDGFSGLIGGWEFLVQTPGYGIVEVTGDSASGRWLTREVGRTADGAGHTNDAFYTDRYVRTPDGWRFASRAYRVFRADDQPVPGKFVGVGP